MGLLLDCVLECFLKTFFSLKSISVNDTFRLCMIMKQIISRSRVFSIEESAEKVKKLMVEQITCG